MKKRSTAEQIQVGRIGMPRIRGHLVAKGEFFPPAGEPLDALQVDISQADRTVSLQAKPPVVANQSEKDHTQRQSQTHGSCQALGNAPDQKRGACDKRHQAEVGNEIETPAQSDLFGTEGVGTRTVNRLH
jgi:hypothetical protein